MAVAISSKEAHRCEQGMVVNSHLLSTCHPLRNLHFHISTLFNNCTASHLWAESLKPGRACERTFVSVKTRALVLHCCKILLSANECRAQQREDCIKSSEWVSSGWQEIFTWTELR